MAEYQTALAKPAIALIVLIQLMASGCESNVAPTDDRAMAHMKVLGLLYGRCMADNRGVPPADQEQYVEFLEREPANWEKLASTPQAFIESARGGHALVVLYGDDLRTPADGDLPWVAYEEPGPADQRMIVNVRGNVQFMDGPQLDQLLKTP